MAYEMRVMTPRGGSHHLRRYDCLEHLHVDMTDASFGTRNVRSMYLSGSLTTVATELAKYKLYLVGVQVNRWDTEGTVRAGE
jgi:hypothetical protein